MKGEWVLLKFPCKETGRNRKLSQPWDRPYRVAGYCAQGVPASGGANPGSLGLAQMAGHLDISGMEGLRDQTTASVSSSVMRNAAPLGKGD